jgi:hypothetical protein
MKRYLGNRTSFSAAVLGAIAASFAVGCADAPADEEDNVGQAEAAITSRGIAVSGCTATAALGCRPSSPVLAQLAASSRHERCMMTAKVASPLQCAHIDFGAQCAAEFGTACDNQCGTSATAKCIDGCEADCAIDCKASADAVCTTACEARCDENCDKVCGGAPEVELCMKSCNAQCDTRCSDSCGSRSDSPCDGRCHGDCDVMCSVEAEVASQIRCSVDLITMCKA